MHLYLSSPSLINCVFESNTAKAGGGMHNDRSDPTLTNCTLSLNVADFGGGMYNYDSAPTLTECLVVNNSADYGGGIYSHYSSTPSLGGTSVCENVPNQVFGDLTDQGGNCINDVCNEQCAFVTCPADIDGDAVVGPSDLTELLARWGCIVDPPGFDCARADLNEDGTVDGADLTVLLSSWGACQYRPPS